MKNITIGLLMALTLSTPALASSWKNELFTKLDTDMSGELSYGELVSAGCRTDPKMFKYADTDRSAALTKSEYFKNRDLLGRCK
jgi:hypothetical protein